MADLTVVILTYNETLHLARALSSVRKIAKRIVVVDSYSTDDTLAIARAGGAEIVQHPFVNQAKQFQWALDTLAIDTAWTLKLDADEIIEPDLAAEIETRLAALPPDVGGVNLKRKTIFLNSWIRHGGRYPITLLRIWRSGRARVEDRWMDEHVLLDSGSTVTFAGGFADHNLNDLSYFIDKHNKYATREAVQVLIERLVTSTSAEAPRAGVTRQAFVKRLLKKGLYGRVPFPLDAIGYFLYRYVVRLGFLDGQAGVIYHILQGFWYRFLVGAKLIELQLGLRRRNPDEEVRVALSRLTGLPLQ
jgi:glycosyltransferase involved in cell wall biosynthesis